MTEKKAKASRKTVKKRKPSFKRHEQFRCKKLKKTWRKPRGRHSKMRVRVASRGRMPSIGYRNPPEVRGLTKSGWREVRVANLSELGKLDPKKDRAVIAHGVGRKKKTEMLKKAEELKIKITNLRKL